MKMKTHNSLRWVRRGDNAYHAPTTQHSSPPPSPSPPPPQLPPPSTRLSGVVLLPKLLSCVALGDGQNCVSRRLEKWLKTGLEKKPLKVFA